MGKSTLSTMIARMLHGLHRLGAFFFFNHDIPQSNFVTLIRTLTHQLASFDARFCAAISQVAASNENIAGLPLDLQFTNLLSASTLKSAEWSRGTIFLVIDALDECGRGDRKVLMQALSKGFSSLPLFIRIIVVSCPESDIQGALGSHLDVRPYTLDNKSTTIKDVSEFVHHRLEEICEEDGYLNADWPVDYKTNDLANSAGSLV